MPTSKRIALEICLYSVESAVAAQSAGADRVELCDNPPHGGTTPSHGMIASAREKLDIGLHVIIRPRGGDFLYSESEFSVMKKDISVCKQLGVDGVVIGILLPDATVDKRSCRKLVDLARPMSVTFHRAFDMTNDPHQALEDIIETGCDRILTSGQAVSASAGASLISKLVKQAANRITIMPGVEITENNLANLAEKTGAREFHTAAGKAIPSKMKFHNSRISMGDGVHGEEYELLTVDQGRIREMRKIADQLSEGSD